MPGAKIPPTLSFAGFPAGINNVVSEEGLPIDEFGRQTSARAAENIDFDAAGKPRRRPGYVLSQALAGLHSLWAHPAFPYMVGVHDNQVLLFDSNLTVVYQQGLYDGASPMSYTMLGSQVFYSNGRDCGLLTDEAARRTWAPEHPYGQPDLAVSTTAGGLEAGTYQIAVTFVDEYGRESGAFLPAEIAVAEGEGISMTNFPEALGGGVQWLRIYSSRPNGETLFAVQDIPYGLTTFLLGAHTPGKQLDRLFLEAMPAGQIVRGHAGRLFVAARSVLVWSEALMFGLTHWTTNTMKFNGRITLVEPAGQAQRAGLFVATAKATYFLSSPDPKDWQRALAYPHGAVAGSVHVDASTLGLEIEGTVPVWLATNGQFVIGLPGGKVQPMHEGRYVAPADAEAVAMALRERDGARHLVATARGGRTSGFRAADVVEAEVWKNGVRIG